LSAFLPVSYNNFGPSVLTPLYKLGSKSRRGQRFKRRNICNISSIESLASTQKETFEKCSILFKTKEGENLNHRNTLSISRIKI